jgi:hypothetical protein
MAKLRHDISRDLQTEAAKRDLMFKVRAHTHGPAILQASDDARSRMLLAVRGWKRDVGSMPLSLWLASTA